MDSRTGTLRMFVRNRLSRIIAAIRKSHGLQPLHRRYGPIKYKYTLPAYRRIAAWLKLGRESKYNTATTYAEWVARCEALRYNHDRAIERINRFASNPIISIIMPTYNTRADFLRKAIRSVLNQYYPYWELCICDDASNAPWVRAIIEEYRDGDERIKVAFADCNAGIAAASNRALSMATGHFIGLVDHDDELTPDALFEVAATLQEADADLIYSDEDRLDVSGHREDPAFKPAWSPDLLLSRMYLGHFCVYRKSIVDQIGGFRGNFDGSQDYDLALRFTEATSRIAHIPRILYHWRKLSSSASGLAAARDSVTEAGRRALIDALRRRDIDGQVENLNIYGLYHVRRRIVARGSVSIIIPTRDGLRHLRRCIESIEAKTEYRKYEVLIIDNGSRSADTLDYLKRTRHRVIRLDEPFNYSRLNNLAVREATGEYLLFLNDDTEVISAEWLTAMIEQAQRREVGAVGAKLLYPDGRIQHAGIVLGVGDVASHAHRGEDGFGSGGYLNLPNAICNYNAVTAACLMIRREVFLEVGGFDQDAFAVSYNDVDLCLRLRNRGYLIVYTPYSVLYHNESATRGKHKYPHEETILRDRWHSSVMSDCYYSPNLGGGGEFTPDFSKPESVVCTFAQNVADLTLCRLDSTTRIGQHFIAERGNLCAIGVHLESTSSDTRGIVRVRVRESADSDRDLAVAEVEASRLRNAQWNIFGFDCVRRSREGKLYFLLEFDTGGREGSLYVKGQASTDTALGPYFENGVPASGTLAFQVHALIQFRYAELSTNPQVTGSI